MSKHSGAAFSKPTDDAPATPDVTTFDPRAWARGTAPVTRSVAVCGRPDLMGHIEALADEIERAQASEMEDQRPLAKSHAVELAQALDACRADMLAAMVVFTFRGLRPGELEAIKAEHGPVDGDGITDLDYKVWARQCIKISPAAGEPAKGVDWETLRLMHRGTPDLEPDDPGFVQGLGVYFVRTIGATANAAASGLGVDVPFSSASSALTQGFSKS